jgi:hypothetical protein
MQPAPQQDATFGKLGAACESTPGGQGPAILDEKRQPIDMTSEAAVEAAAGRPVILCAPVRRALAGRVVDTATGRPIPGALVVVESWQTPAPIGGPQPERRLVDSIGVRTDASGRWSVPTESQWALGILAADGFPVFVDGYCAKASGYTSFVFDPWKAAGEHFGKPPVEASLRPAEQQPAPQATARQSTCGIPLDPEL